MTNTNLVELLFCFFKSIFVFLTLSCPRCLTLQRKPRIRSHFVYSSIGAARPRRFAVRPCAFLQIHPWMLNNSARSSLRSSGKWQLQQWVVAVATRKGKSATSCIVRPECLFALWGGADGFSRFTGDMALYFFGSAYMNIISYTICHISNGIMTPASKSQI